MEFIIYIMQLVDISSFVVTPKLANDLRRLVTLSIQVGLLISQWIHCCLSSEVYHRWHSC